MKSIFQEERECWICKHVQHVPNNGALERHHVFNGWGTRQISEKEGCVCYLCVPHHMKVTAHKYCDENIALMKEAKLAWMTKNHKGHEDFIKRFGKAYV